MAIYTKVSGAWKEVTQPSVKVSGAWKNCSEVHVKVSGVWKKVWEAVSSYIAAGHSGSPCFTLLKRSGDSVSLASTYTLPSIGRSCSFSPDGTYIAVAHYGSPCFTLLKRSGDSVSLASTYTLPGIGYGCSFWESS